MAISTSNKQKPDIHGGANKEKMNGFKAEIEVNHCATSDTMM